jgi:hypothetical protein
MIVALVWMATLQTHNTLTPAERKAGWELLFDGKTTKGWHNYKAKGVGEGWQAKDGVLGIVDVEKAGDIVTDQKFSWFELQLDYNLGPGQNSGIMFWVTEEGKTTWQSGPEVQLYDHPPQEGVETSGFLYQLYSSPVDASKPAGEWNHLRILISPKKCQTDLNGVKYYEFVYGSKDFWDRVAKSKFSKYPFFAKTTNGSIAIQGDHGNVFFRNIKIRRIKG